jgi:hypothetical protein
MQIACHLEEVDGGRRMDRVLRAGMRAEVSG